jgi:hypothetical protein
MTPTDRHTVRVVARHVLGCHLSTYTWFWIVLLLCWGGLVTALAVFTDIRTSAWEWVSTSAPKWFLLVLSIIAAVGALPMYLAQGITRRHFALASLAVGVPVALVFGIISLAGYGVEYLTFSATGLLSEQTSSYPIGSVGDGLAVVGEATVSLLAWMATGWLIGLGFYRFGALWGLLFLPVASVPLMAVEWTFNADRLGFAFDSTLGVVAVVAGVAATYLLVRDVPVRKISG